MNITPECLSCREEQRDCIDPATARLELTCRNCGAFIPTRRAIFHAVHRREITYAEYVGLMVRLDGEVRRGAESAPWRTNRAGVERHARALARRKQAS